MLIPSPSPLEEDYNFIFFSRFKEKLLKEQQARALALAQGTCDTLEEYKLHVGRIQGLDEALRILREVADELNTEDL